MENTSLEKKDGCFQLQEFKWHLEEFKRISCIHVVVYIIALSPPSFKHQISLKAPGTPAFPSDRYIETFLWFCFGIFQNLPVRR